MLVTILLKYLVFFLINCNVWADSQWSQVGLEPDVFKATDSTEPLHCSSRFFKDSSSDCLSLPPAVIGQVVTPTRVGQSYTYSPGQHNQQDLYDVPPCRSQGVGVSCTAHQYDSLHYMSYTLWFKWLVWEHLLKISYLLPFWACRFPLISTYYFMNCTIAHTLH